MSNMQRHRPGVPDWTSGLDRLDESEWTEEFGLAVCDRIRERPEEGVDAAVRYRRSAEGRRVARYARAAGLVWQRYILITPCPDWHA
jgi:hypothetical protein